MSVQTTSSPSTEQAPLPQGDKNANRPFASTPSPSYYFGAIDSCTNNHAAQTPAVTASNNSNSYFTTRPVAATPAATTSTGSSMFLPAVSEAKGGGGRKPRPMALDLSSTQQQPINSNDTTVNGLRTPNSATYPPASSSGFPRLGLNHNNPGSTAAANSSSLHVKHKSLSLPTNNIQTEVPDNVSAISVNELNELIVGRRRTSAAAAAAAAEDDDDTIMGGTCHSNTNNNEMLPSPPSSLSSHNGPEGELLIVDVRPFVQYSTKRIKGAINVCIPTTLLKRSTFRLAKFLETTCQNQNLQELGSYNHIVLYDNSCQELRNSQHAPLLHTIWKFLKCNDVASDTKVQFLKGGFLAFQENCPGLLDQELVTKAHVDKNQPVSNLAGFSLPEASVKDGPMNAFASNIRTAMEVYDSERDRVEVKLPPEVKPFAAINQQIFPAWLCEIINEAGSSNILGKKFTEIEMAEKNRLQTAFGNAQVSRRASYDSNAMTLAGVELGAKNRYNNIWPFDHTRVKVQSCSSPSGDYINASRIHTWPSSKRYIATQGPLPATFGDFWQVVYDEKVPVIVMLTLENEGGMLKCDPYWRDGKMGKSLNLKTVQEVSMPLDGSGTHVMVRRFELTRDGDDTKHMVTQIQYTDWPDLGSPVSATDLLSLGRVKQSYITEWQQANPPGTEEPQSIVHCSAGCGRTGTFCTVDSVVDIFAKQLAQTGEFPKEDVVNQVVHDIRRQRLSMVQNLRQYAMCYETVIQWCVEQAKRDGKI